MTIGIKHIAWISFVICLGLTVWAQADAIEDFIAQLQSPEGEVRDENENALHPTDNTLAHHLALFG